MHPYNKDLVDPHYVMFEYGNNYRQVCEERECAADLNCGFYNGRKVRRCRLNTSG